MSDTLAEIEIEQLQSELSRLRKQVFKVKKSHAKLFDENKILKEEVKKLVNASKYILEQFKPLEQSRDDLLFWCKAMRNQYSNEGKFITRLNEVIKRAEAPKP